MSWPLGVVSDIADVISGYAFKSEWFGGGGDKVIRIGDLQNGRIQLDTALTVDASAIKVADQFKIKAGDILMALSGATVGKIAIAKECDQGAYINQRVAIIRGRSSEGSDFVKYIFSGELQDELLKNAGGAAQPNLSPKNISSLVIPIPPLSEQKRIAAILDKADAIRRKRQQAIKLADDFLRSVFLEMFGDPVTNPKGWEVKKLDDLCAKITDGEHGTVGRTESGRPYLMARNIDRNGNFDLTEVSYIGEEDHQRIYKRCGAESGDILLVCVGATIGKAAIVPDMEQFSLARSVALLKPNGITSSQYLLYLIKTNGIQGKFISSGNSSAQAGLYLGKIKALEVPCPPPELQNKFSIIERKVKLMVAKLECSKGFPLFDSLSQKAFSGKL